MIWDADVPLFRVHGRQYDGLSFNRKQGLDFRFSSLCVGGQPLGVMYAADSLLGAISETKRIGGIQPMRQAIADLQAALYQ